jgi:hypothetical protein
MAFGMAGKLLLPEGVWDDAAPPTAFDNVSPELAAFQAGFTELNARTIKTPGDAEELLDTLKFIAEVNMGRKHRPRDLSRKFNTLRKRTQKSLKEAKVSKSNRGTFIFFLSLIMKYVRCKPMKTPLLQLD